MKKKSDRKIVKKNKKQNKKTLDHKIMKKKKKKRKKYKLWQLKDKH